LNSLRFRIARWVMHHRRLTAAGFVMALAPNASMSRSKRNANRFPADFMFQLTAEEATGLRSPTATSNTSRRGGRRYRPYAFTEHGAIQVANVLNSPRAVDTSIYVVRAFVQLREMLSSNKELARRVDDLEARIQKKLVTHDEAIAAILSAIRELMNPSTTKDRGIGFTAKL
jgi:hypothetical protein